MDMEDDVGTTAPPPPPEEAPAAPSEAPQDASPAATPSVLVDAAAPDPGLVVAEYVGESPRTYHWPGRPQTAGLGDVCEIPAALPTDGCWIPSTKTVTRLPDNHPDYSPVVDWDNVATSLADHEAILARLGIEKEA